MPKRSCIRVSGRMVRSLCCRGILGRVEALVKASHRSAWHVHAAIEASAVASTEYAGSFRLVRCELEVVFERRNGAGTGSTSLCDLTRRCPAMISIEHVSDDELLLASARGRSSSKPGERQGPGGTAPGETR